MHGIVGASVSEFYRHGYPISMAYGVQQKATNVAYATTYAYM